MHHDANKERQEVSLIGRLLSMEGLILVMGCLSLVVGIVEGKMISIFWGVLILCGFFVLIKVRKKDWKKHWEELEAEQKSRNERNKRDSQNPPDDAPGKE